MILLSGSSQSRRRATRRIFLAAFGVAALAYTTINFFENQIDARRLEQLRVSRFNNDVTTVLGDLDSLLLGEQVEEIHDDLHDMDTDLSLVALNASQDELKSVQKAYAEFLGAVGKERAAVADKQMPLAHRLDRDSTDPAFEQLKETLEAFDERLQGQAIFWTNAIDAAVGTSLLLSAMLVAGLIVRYQRKVESTVRMEAQQQSVESSERKLKSLIQNSADVFVVVTPEGVVSMVSDACEKAWGRSVDSLVDRPIYDLVEAADGLRLKRSLADLLATNFATPTLELSMDDGRKGLRPFEVQVTDLTDDPSVGGILLTFHDLTDRKKYESELTYHAFHDRLTGLPNRALFLDRLSHRLKATENGDEGFAVLFIDLDNFKVVNDSLGHEAGDTLLVEVATRLQSAVRPVDTVARMGGDEFTIILDEAKASETAIDVAERIQKALVLPVSLGEREIFVTSSIGIVMTEDSGLDAAGLLRDADTAMYQAKGNGKAALAVFEPSMNLLALDRLELESDLRVAIQEEQFYLAYQPIVDIATSRLREVEALIRWQHPTRGLISPGTFIPLAEETGLICAIGRWALRESFAQLADWNQGLYGDDRLHLSVNVSARQFQEKEFVGEVQALLQEMRLDPKLIELEVTETAMLNDLLKMKQVFTQLRDLGLRVAIDDFGTGYSSMAYLSQLPVDKLKIDRSFVIPLGQDDRADGVVQAMITMARTLGLGITGEGVETEEQLAALQTMGCDLGQGFLFNRPLSADSVTRMVSGSSAALDSLPKAA